MGFQSSVKCLWYVFYIFTSVGIYKATKAMQSLYKDLSCNGPACALLQGASTQQVQQLRAVLCNSQFKFNSSYMGRLQLLQSEFPLLFSYLMKAKVGDSIPDSIRGVLLSIVERAEKTFMSAPQINTYAPAEDEELFKESHFFPTLPRLHRFVNQNLVGKCCEELRFSVCRGTSTAFCWDVIL